MIGQLFPTAIGVFLIIVLLAFIAFNVVMIGVEIYREIRK